MSDRRSRGTAVVNRVTLRRRLLAARNETPLSPDFTAAPESAACRAVIAA
jgi:hypothetical protein